MAGAGPETKCEAEGDIHYWASPVPAGAARGLTVLDLKWFLAAGQRAEVFAGRCCPRN